MPSQRIALLIHSLDGGGAERLMAQLATRWHDQGHEVHLITWSAAATDRYFVPDAIHRVGLDLMKTSSNPIAGIWANLDRVRKLRRQLQHIAPDRVLSFCDKMNIATLQAARGLALPVWIAEHSNPERQKLSRLWEYWRRSVYPSCSGCVALTDGIANYMTRWIAHEKLVVIPPAIQPPAWTQALVKHCGASESGANERSSPRRFLSVGRLSHEKGVDLLVEGWREINQQLPDWELWIAGDGPQRAALEHAVADLPRIRFLGWLEDPWQVYKQASVFVLPSRYEGFPVALLEAMSQGLPGIATQCTEAMQVIDRAVPESIFLVEPQSPKMLARAMLELASDDARRAELARRGPMVAANYHWDHIGEKWDAILPV
ncbi:MAG: glycosyltransferase [Planctomycetales bacterium]|nr:glycosyltransferase [Planctomycetales bacterium]